MDLSIVIVNWNTCELLAQCLQSVYQTTTNLNAELLVVDNASNDGSSVMVSTRYPRVQLLQNAENVGFARANNQGIRSSIGRYVLLLNSDTEIRPGALETMIAFMDQHPDAAAAGARLLNADGSLQPSCHPILTAGREFWRLFFLEPLHRRATYDMAHWDPQIPRQVETIKGACLLLRRAALGQVGLLDEQYFMYTEEMDLCLRLLRAGWKLYWIPQAQVVHYGEASSRQVAEAMYIQLYRSKVQFQRKFWGKRQAQYFKTLMFLAYLPRAALVSFGSLVNPALSARGHAYRRLLRELPGM